MHLNIYRWLTTLFTILLVLFLNGLLIIPGVVLPPLGKLLDPYHGVWNHHGSKDSESFEKHEKTLTESATVYYDHKLVPHIHAGNLEDLMFLQGYTEARHRLFQMEFMALAAAGELSSVIGEKGIQHDLSMRRRGMTTAAAKTVAAWENMPEYKYVQKYIDGVNAYINQLNYKDLPFECKLLNIIPEKWTAYKSALVYKQMALTLAGYSDDMEYSNLLNILGTEKFHDLYPETEQIENPVVPEDWKFDFDKIYGKPQQKTAYADKMIPKSFHENRYKGIGSNSWSVNGKKSASGAPIFCNDPHLSLSLPSIWFELHLLTKDFNAYGVSFPGFPGIMIGFNEYIAWGETNVCQDVEDLFLIEWTDQSRTAYLLDGKKTEAVLKIEKIDVKGGKTVLDTVRYTHWGPVVLLSKDKKHDIAMKWIALEEPDMAEFMVFVDAMSSKNYDDFLKSSDRFISPAQNFNFASKSGDIAIRVNGKFPVRHDQDGRFVEYGNNSEYDWQGYIPRIQNPHVVNPDRNFVVSANQRSTSRDYPYYYTGLFEHYRNRSIIDRLNARNGFTVKDMMNLQTDAYSVKASDFVPVLLNSLSKFTLSPEEIIWVDALKKWDFNYHKTSREATFFDMFMASLNEEVWDEFTPYQDSLDIILPKDWRLLELLKTQSDHPFFDHKSTLERENGHTSILKAFKSTLIKMDEWKKSGKSDQWSVYKPLNILHLTKIPALSKKGLEAHGCTDAINATGKSYGPSWRMIVHLDKEIEAYGVYPGGQSGNPFSPYYANMVGDWLDGKYHKLEWSRDITSWDKKPLAVCVFKK